MQQRICSSRCLVGNYIWCEVLKCKPRLGIRTAIKAQLVQKLGRASQKNFEVKEDPGKYRLFCGRAMYNILNYLRCFCSDQIVPEITQWCSGPCRTFGMYQSWQLFDCNQWRNDATTEFWRNDLQATQWNTTDPFTLPKCFLSPSKCKVIRNQAKICVNLINLRWKRHSKHCCIKWLDR